MEINNNIRRHAKFQVEIDNNFPIHYNSKKKQKVEIDTYLFFPKSLNVTSERFNKDSIYNTLQRVFRLKASSQLLTDLYASGDHYLEEIEELLSDQKTKNQKVITKMKLFICAYESSLKKRRNRVVTSKDLVGTDAYYKDFDMQVTIYSKRFRELRSKINNDSLLEHFNFIDEYLSYILRSNCLKLLQIISKTEMNEGHAKLIEELVTTEYSYAQQHNFPLPEKGSSNRKYVYRIKGILKKNIWNVHYLDVKRKEDAQFFTQLLYGLAAGMAMVFATLIAFFAQRKYGNYSYPLFTALVVGYIFKDRIKELSKDFLKNAFDTKTFDKKTDLLSHDHLKLGTLQERVSFLHKKELPQLILESREKHREANIIREYQDDETVINYQKRLRINHKLFNSNYSELISDGIKSITRIDLTPYVSMMDNPKHFALGLDADTKKVEKIVCFRTYHITILICYKSSNKTFTERFRVILGQDGIHAIEKRL